MTEESASADRELDALRRVATLVAQGVQAAYCVTEPGAGRRFIPEGVDPSGAAS